MAAVTYEIVRNSIFVILSLSLSVNSIKLNVPRVLLPYSQGVSANFTLEVTDGGCFRWYMSRPEVIKLHVVDSENKGCSSKAIVSSISKVPTLQSTLVTLINDDTGESLHCDVAVTSISRLEITTTTRELLLDDTPEAFTIRALDKEGDTFSSLDGLVFDWNLITTHDEENSVDARYILRFIKFSESLYKASPAIYALEAQNKRGYTVLVQGIKTGSAIVHASLKDIAYPQGLLTEVTLSVVANLVLSPSYEVRVLVGSIITYQVLIIQQGKALRIDMPSSQFNLELTDENIASLNSRTSEVEALAIGYTEVILKDQNVKTKQLFRQPSAGIHVVPPHHIEFTLLPYQNWQLICKQRYIILINIYDRNNSQIFNTDNIRIEAEFPNEYFEVVDKSANGSYYEVYTLATGSSKISARLKGIVNKYQQIIEPNQLIEDNQVVDIVDKIRVEPKLVILPWNPVTKPSYDLHFEAYGGGNSGYHWKTSNTNIATCSQDGKVYTKQNGSVNIIASSVRNQHNYAMSNIYILQPYAVEILSSHVEIEIDKIINIPVALYAMFGPEKIRTAFTNCTQYPVDVDLVDKAKLQYLTDYPAGDVNNTDSCVALPVKGLLTGFTKLTVSFQNGEEILKNSTMVAVYRPLTIISPVDDDVVLLSLGAMLSVAFQGGPRPWHLSPRNFFRNLRVENTTVATAKLYTNVDNKIDDLHVFSVACKELGETVVTLRVGNQKSSTNVHPVISEAQVRVICQVPTMMELRPLIPQPKTSHSQICNFNKHKFPVHCYRDLDIIVVMRDSLGRIFDNFTSIGVSWELSNTSLATITKEETLLVIEDMHDGYKTLDRAYQKLIPNNQEGPLKVTARANAYLLNLNKYIENDSGFDLIANLYLELVDDAQFVEDELSVFNHPQNKVLLTVSKGSGHFDFQPKDQSVASIYYDDKLREFVVVPKTEGSFVLTLYDVCLETRSHATAVVRVSGIHDVEVNMVDKVGVNKEITAFVRILDKDHSYLPASVFHLLNIIAVPASNIISTRPLVDCQPLKNALCFAILGKTLGQTMLTFSVTQKRSSANDLLTEIAKSSDPIPIQVFSPLRLHPRNITLIIGAAFQVLSSGGPLPQSSIEYSVENSDVASVNSTGIITGLKLGKTSITGRAVGIDSETGSSVVYSQDQLNIYVIALTGIRIRTRLTRLQSGSLIPVYAIGVHDYETPFTFGSALPSLSYKWSISNKEVATLEPVYQQCGIQLQDDNQFMIRVRANHVGRVTLFLKVSVNVPSQNGQHQIAMDETLVDELQLEVFEKLRLVSPAFDNQEITMSPKTSLKLLTNKDHLGLKVVYRLSDSTCPGANDISVDRNANLLTSQSICRATLTITASDEIDFNQTISTLVVVKPISYMMVVPSCSMFTKREALFVLPVGTRTLFQVFYYDNFGKEFQATNSRLKFLTSRNDLLQIIQGPKNGTFYVKINNPGHTILRVWDAENLGIDDYILILSGEVIQPLRTSVTLGDYICFTSPLVSEAGELGTWSSDNQDTLHINSFSGIGIANNVGVTTVTHNTSIDVATKTEINVNPVQAITFATYSSGKHLTNAFLDKPYFFPLVLRGDELSSRISNLLGKDCSIDNKFIPTGALPYKCILKFNGDVEVPMESVFDVTETFDTNSGRHGCVVTPTQQSPELLEQLSTLKTSLVLNVVTLPRPRQDLISSDTLHIAFNPAFSVPKGQLVLGSGAHSVQLITVSATDMIFNYITVTSNDSRLVDVDAPQSHITDKAKRIYPIRLSDQSWQRFSEFPSSNVAATINIICSLTNQVVSIPVLVKAIGDEYSKCRPAERSGWSGLFAAVADSYSNIIFTLLAILCTGIALFISYHAVFKSKTAIPPNFYNRFGSGEGRIYPSASRSFNGSMDGTHLWSVNEPVHGSPSFSRTPSPRFRNANDRY